MKTNKGSDYAIDIQHLSVRYGTIYALKDINLQIEYGDFVGIIGPNGGGKSTLLKSILGLVTPVSGHILVLGATPQQGRSQVGYVPQATNINKQFPISVREAVLMGRMVGNSGFLHRYNQEDQDIVQSYLERLEIADLSDRQIGQLSGGQLQRVLIARALVVLPQILLLDEPTASLDAHSSSQIYEILQGLNQDVTIVIVTHDTLAVSSYLKTIACINQNLYYHGDPDLSSDLVMQLYGCPVELIAHGVPHRVLGDHNHGGK
ncbi:MAG: metal ABC transporter ATP-binding protein [Syntrophomonas sp.]|nr:metal ABC transporter ATP-binding protein [Syntrophomonas sp.]